MAPSWRADGVDLNQTVFALDEMDPQFSCRARYFLTGAIELKVGVWVGTLTNNMPGAELARRASTSWNLPSMRPWKACRSSFFGATPSSKSCPSLLLSAPQFEADRRGPFCACLLLQASGWVASTAIPVALQPLSEIAAWPLLARPRGPVERSRSFSCLFRLRAASEQSVSG